MYFATVFVHLHHSKSKIIIMANITVAMGDGIGPEIMKATLQILKASGVDLNVDYIEIGEQSYLNGNTSGIDDSAWDTIIRNKILLKAPITTPQGGGYKSLNVTMRKTLSLFANVRPCRSLHPFVYSKHPDLDLTIVRENEEDLYGGIEHQQTDEVVQCLKLISRPGSERIIRYAFEYAVANKKNKVTCLTKDNIMKQTDGLFHKVFREIGEDYPSIEKEHLIIDIGTALIADQPGRFEVIVTPNLYGDIVSDITAQISGSVGLGGSSNIGAKCAMFEAIHGSAPTIAGQNIANPSGLLQGSLMMLNHIGEPEHAARIGNAWLTTIEQGIHTADIFNTSTSKQSVGTDDFTKAVIENFGNKPKELKPFDKLEKKQIHIPEYVRPKPAKKTLEGVDLFVHWGGQEANELASNLQKANTDKLELIMITNRGVRVWPDGFDETFCTDHWRCRFQAVGSSEIASTDIVQLMTNCIDEGIDVIKTENLYAFNGERAYSLGQGQVEKAKV